MSGVIRGCHSPKQFASRRFSSHAPFKSLIPFHMFFVFIIHPHIFCFLLSHSSFTHLLIYLLLSRSQSLASVFFLSFFNSPPSVSLPLSLFACFYFLFSLFFCLFSFTSCVARYVSQHGFLSLTQTRL